MQVDGALGDLHAGVDEHGPVRSGVDVAGPQVAMHQGGALGRPVEAAEQGLEAAGEGRAERGGGGLEQGSEASGDGWNGKRFTPVRVSRIVGP